MILFRFLLNTQILLTSWTSFLLRFITISSLKYIYTIFNTWLHFWLNIAFAINRINILFSAINWINIWFPLKSNMNFLLYFWNDIISVSSKYSQTVYLINWHFHYDFSNKIYKIRPHSIIAFVSYCITIN